MRIDRLDKSAGTVSDVVYNQIKDAPIAPEHVFDKTIQTPQQLQSYTISTRARQAQAAEQLTKLLGAGLMVGGAGALAYGIPKLLKTRKAIATKPEELIDEPSEFGVKAANNFMSEVRNLAGNAVTGTKNLIGNIATNPSTAPYAGVAESPSEVSVGGIPPGGLWPAYAAAIPAGIMGGAALTNWLTNKARKQMLDRKKHQLQTQFSSLLSGTPKTASARMLEHMATECTEKKAWGPGMTGVALSALGLAGLAGWSGGRAAGKRINPDYTKRQEIEKALKAKSKSQPITFNIEPTADKEEFSNGPKPVSQLANEEYRLPMVLPNRRKNLLPEHDEALDFGKLSSFCKFALTGAEQRAAANAGKPAPAPLSTSTLSAYPKAFINTAGAIPRWIGENVAEGAASSPTAKNIQESLSGLGATGAGLSDRLGKMEGRVGKFMDTAEGTMKDIRAPFQYLGNAARGVRDYMKPLSSMLMSGLAGLPQMAANGLHSMGIGQAAQAPAVAGTKPAVTPIAQPAAAPLTQMQAQQAASVPVTANQAPVVAAKPDTGTEAATSAAKNAPVAFKSAPVTMPGAATAVKK